MRNITLLCTTFAATCLVAAACVTTDPDEELADPSWQQEFGISDCDLESTGQSDFFVLEPGFQLVLESKSERLTITVTDDTRQVDGVTTRVVEEREWKNDELVEVSRNFHAICPETNGAFYFGEEVDDHKNGEVVNHQGAWLAGVDNAKPGLIMSGEPPWACATSKRSPRTSRWTEPRSLA
jgi:hypothetical protein